MRKIKIYCLTNENTGKTFVNIKINDSKDKTKNNESVCISLSPKEFFDLVNQIEDIQLLLLAKNREKSLNRGRIFTEQEVLKRLNISENELENLKEIDIC